MEDTFSPPGRSWALTSGSTHDAPPTAVLAFADRAPRTGRLRRAGARPRRHQAHRSHGQCEPLRYRGHADRPGHLHRVARGTAQLGISVSGLTPGTHGMHIHENGACNAPSFESAGPHFNPAGKKHGLENPDGPHAGDLPNLLAREDGSADTTFTVATSLLTRGAGSMIGEQKRAFVIHADPDDQRTDPERQLRQPRRLRGDRAPLSRRSATRVTLLRLTERGLYCEAGEFFVDPWGAVDRAVVTHAHGDHVAWGSAGYLTSAEGPRCAAEPPSAGRARHRPSLRRDSLPQRRPGLAASRRTHPRLLPGPRSSSAARSGSSPATTRPIPIPPPRRSSRSAATPSSPSPPSDSRSIAGLRRPKCSATSTPGGAPIRRRARRACSTATPSARRSGCWRASTPTSDRSTPTARWSG